MRDLHTVEDRSPSERTRCAPPASAMPTQAQKERHLVTEAHDCTPSGTSSKRRDRSGCCTRSLPQPRHAMLVMTALFDATRPREIGALRTAALDCTRPAASRGLATCDPRCDQAAQSSAGRPSLGLEIALSRADARDARAWSSVAFPLLRSKRRSKASRPRRAVRAGCTEDRATTRSWSRVGPSGVVGGARRTYRAAHHTFTSSALRPFARRCQRDACTNPGPRRT